MATSSSRVMGGCGSVCGITASSLARALGERPREGCPFSRMVPVQWWRAPAMQRASEDFPLPFLPSRAVICPGRAVRLAPCRMVFLR